VSTAEEIRTAIPKLPRAEIEAIREWIDDYLEGRLELTDAVKEKLDQSRAKLQPGNTRPANRFAPRDYSSASR